MPPVGVPGWTPYGQVATAAAAFTGLTSWLCLTLPLCLTVFVTWLVSVSMVTTQR